MEKSAAQRMCERHFMNSKKYKASPIYFAIFAERFLVTCPLCSEEKNTVGRILYEDFNQIIKGVR